MLDSDADWPERESEENHKLLIEYDILLGIYSKCLRHAISIHLNIRYIRNAMWDTCACTRDVRTSKVN